MCVIYIFISFVYVKDDISFCNLYDYFRKFIYLFCVVNWIILCATFIVLCDLIFLFACTCWSKRTWPSRGLDCKYLCCRNVCWNNLDRQLLLEIGWLVYFICTVSTIIWETNNVQCENELFIRLLFCVIYCFCLHVLVVVILFDLIIDTWFSYLFCVIYMFYMV